MAANRKRLKHFRELQKNAQREEAWRKLRTEPRRINEDISAPGAGPLRIKLLHLPSFSPGEYWEIRQLPNEWILYASAVVDRRPSTTLLGFDRISIDSSELQEFFERLTKLALPISPVLSNTAGLDGEITELGIFGDLHSAVRFTWWSEPPIDWAPLVEIASEMLAAFRRHSRLKPNA